MLCIHRHGELPSTNDEAIRLAKAGAPEGAVVWAGSQTAGRGRRGRGWISPPGNLYLSVIVRPDLPLDRAGRIAVASALALAQTLQRETALPIRTKWPNDLYLHGRKLGGILVETRALPGGRLEWAVVGLGLNVAGHPDVPPPGAPATSLAEHGVPLSPEGLVSSLALAIVRSATIAEAGWGPWVGRVWPETDLAHGPIRVDEDGSAYEAEGVGMDGDGALIVRAGGAARRVTAGEVSVRPR